MALVLHALVVAVLILLAPATPGSPPDVAEIEVALLDPAPVPPAKEAPPPVAESEAARPRPVPPPAASPAPPDPEPPQPSEPKTAAAPTPPDPGPPQPLEPKAAAAAAPTPPPLQNQGFAIRPDPLSATEPPPTPPRPDVFSPQPAVRSAPAPKAPAPTPVTRMAPVVVTSDQRDPRLPAYPAEARYRGEQGDVLVEVELDPSGALRSVRIKKSSGHPSLDTAALRSTRVLRFRPPQPPPGVVLHNLIMVEIPFSYRLQ